MKKITALLLAVLMCLSVFSACSKSKEPTSASAENASANANVQYENVKIRVSLQSNENETQAMLWKEFQKYVEDATGGAVTFDVYYGGVLGSPPEELDMLKSGTIDFAIPMHVMFPNELMFMNFPGFVKGDTPEDILNYARYVMFENETTSALIDKEAEEWNVKYLNVNYSGHTAFLGVEDFSTLADLKGRKLGNVNTAQFKAAGMNVVTVSPLDLYDSLDRGVCDFTQMAVDGIYALKWYEVTTTMVMDGLCAFGNCFTIRRDLYDSFSPALQAVFDEAAAYAGEKYTEQVIKQEEEYIAAMTDTGLTVKDFSKEDAAAWAKIQLDCAFESQMTFAEGQSKEDRCAEMQQIIKDYLEQNLGYVFD